jgi:hypothetical protein
MNTDGHRFLNNKIKADAGGSSLNREIRGIRERRIKFPGNFQPQSRGSAPKTDGHRYKVNNQDAKTRRDGRG